MPTPTRLTTEPFINEDNGGVWLDNGLISSDGQGNLTAKSVNMVGGILNVLQYGADPTGVNDSTTAIQSAINAAAGGITNGTNTQGGAVYFPAGTYLHSGLILYNFIHLLGDGVSATILKLKNGSNTDCIQGYNAPALIGGSSSGGIANWSISNMTIDGNKANQSSASYGIRQYGYGYRLLNMIVKNTYSDAFYSDWNGGGTSGNDSMEAFIDNVKFHDTGVGSMGINFHGPHDTLFSNVIAFNTGSHAFYVGPNAGGTMFSQCHGWGMAQGVNAVAFLLETTVYCTNCYGEGSDVVQVVMLWNKSTWVGGTILSGGVGSPVNNVSGIQLGQQAGLTPFPGSSNQSGGLTTAAAISGYIVDTTFNACEGPNGSVYFANDAGSSFVRATINLTGANSSLLLHGTVHNATTMSLIPHGIASDGTSQKSGWSKLGILANKAWTVSDITNDIVNVSTSGKKLELVNGTNLITYSDNYATVGTQIRNGTVALGQSTSAAAIATGGTITTNNVGAARVAPTGAVTGVILQSGTLPSQIVIVCNESAFSITLSTANLSAGATATIAANSKQIYCWDSIPGVWF